MYIVTYTPSILLNLESCIEICVLGNTKSKNLRMPSNTNFPVLCYVRLKLFEIVMKVRLLDKHVKIYYRPIVDAVTT